MLDPEEIFADLINYRKEIHAPEVHVDCEVKPFRFLLYNPANDDSRVHFMTCPTVRQAQTQGRLVNWRRTSSDSEVFRIYGSLPRSLSVCHNCVNTWNMHFPDKRLDEPVNFVKLFAMMEYDPHFWDGIDLPPEISVHEFMPEYFLLYMPVNRSRFHFMKCKTVCHDEEIGWIKAYRFTNRTSGAFEMFDGTIAKLHPCRECLSEWDNGTGWKGYTNASDDEKKAIAAGFRIDEFFKYCASQEQRPHELTELYHLMDDHKVWFSAHVNNDYPNNWPEITNMYRAAKRYRCEICGVDMSSNHELAVTHHVNGSHPDVPPDNMRVLCVECHAKQPYHNPHIDHDKRVLLKRLRSEQGIHA